MKLTSFFFSVLLVLASIGADAQKSKFSGIGSGEDDDDYQSPFSIKIGYNISNVLVSPEPMNIITSKNSFHVGIATEKQFNKAVGIQPELQYSLQGFSVGGFGKVGLHYISMPILAKLNMGKNTSILVGPQLSYLANARIGLGSDLFSLNYDGAFQQWDASLVAGGEYKISEKINVGARYLYGLNNINKDFEWGNNSSLNDYLTLRNNTAQFYVRLKL